MLDPIAAAADGARVWAADEQAVIGALLTDAEAASSAIHHLDQGDFYDHKCRIIFHVACALVKQGLVPDEVSVTNELRRRNLLDQAGGSAWISLIALEIPDVANVDWYVDKVHRAAVARRLQKRIAQLGPHTITDADVSDLTELLGEIGNVGKVTKSGSLQDLWRPAGVEAVSTCPPPREWLLRHPGGNGLLPRGRVGLLAGEGGCGKTLVLIDLAIAIATGRPWLGHFLVDEDAVGGRVVLLMGEEERPELVRRIHRIATARGLTETERRLCGERIYLVPLAGVLVQITEAVGRQLVTTHRLKEIRELLAKEGDSTLVVLDPLSRFAGGDVEASNEAATRFVQGVESLTHAPGNPTVIVAAHSSKSSRRSGGVDVRGVTGLSDAARWVGTLTAKGNGVDFQQVKSNYSMPMPDPLLLSWQDGVLSEMTSAERETLRQQADAQRTIQLEGDVDRVVDVLQRLGSMSSKDNISRVAGIKAVRGRAAVDLAIARGIVEVAGTSRDREYRLVSAA